tara:strand:- start:211 stop:969 length:759 start_codon:yes stop_codon:yes gene_type:complete
MIDIEIIPRIKDFEILLDTYKPVKANKFLPEWYKKQKYITMQSAWSDADDIDNIPKTIKNCPAVREYITDGIVIPSWTDIIINKKDEKYSWNITVQNSYSLKHNTLLTMDKHIIEQTKPLELNNIKNFGTLKLTCPYWFRTPKGYGLQFLDPFYNHRNNIRLLPGKVETDIWHEVNLPFEFNEDLSEIKNKKLLLKAGDPLLLVTPYKIKEKFNLKICEFSSEFNELQNKNNIINNSVSNNWNSYQSIKNEK